MNITLQKLSSLPEYIRWPDSSAKQTVLTSDCNKKKTHQTDPPSNVTNKGPPWFTILNVNSTKMKEQAEKILRLHIWLPSRNPQLYSKMNH